jgi:tetratricopeptide (TPR) repeat protein
MEIKPETVEIYYNRALTYFELGKITEAENDLAYVLFLDDKNSQANYKLGNLYYEQQKIDKAIIHFSNTIEIDKKNEWAYYWLGICFDNKKAYDKAIQYYQNFIELVPTKYFRHKVIIQNRIKKLQKFER